MGIHLAAAIGDGNTGDGQTAQGNIRQPHAFYNAPYRVTVLRS